MTYLFNCVYLIVGLVLSPWLFYKVLTTGKYRRGLRQKLSGIALVRDGETRCAWFHGVSVGEVHLLRPIVRRFRQAHPTWDCVVSTTTDTGFEEARKRFPDLSVFYWPFDFSWAVRRALRRVNPTLVVLAESELWPNFLTSARRRGVAIALANARMSPRTVRRLARLPALARRLVRGVDLVLAQTPDIAADFVRLGADPGRVEVIGSVKYDGIQTDRTNPETLRLQRLFEIAETDLVLIAGSTQEPEEEIVLAIYRRLRLDYPHLRLFLVPRQKDRFEAVARLLQRLHEPHVRRSSLSGSGTDRSRIVLVDTIGELGFLWGLADIAFVGGSMDGRRGGQNMIEPAAYGAAVLFGPHVWNFRDAARRLVAAGGALQVDSPQALETAIRQLAGDAAFRGRLGEAARSLVLAQQGAADKTIAGLDRMILSRQGASRAA